MSLLVTLARFTPSLEHRWVRVACLVSSNLQHHMLRPCAVQFGLSGCLRCAQKRISIKGYSPRFLGDLIDVQYFWLSLCANPMGGNQGATHHHGY
jgi:hypothetical protein